MYFLPGLENIAYLYVALGFSYHFGTASLMVLCKNIDKKQRIQLFGCL
jgi:hypothetical protein